MTNLVKLLSLLDFQPQVILIKNSYKWLEGSSFALLEALRDCKEDYTITRICVGVHQDDDSKLKFDYSAYVKICPTVVITIKED